MLIPEYSGQFKKDIKLAGKRLKDLDKLKEIVCMIIAETPLPPRCREHKLSGKWKGFTDVHIEPDWLLIYIVREQSVRFERTGTHSDLFTL